MVATKDPYIESAYQKLQIISQYKQKRLEYEACEKAIRDHNQFVYEAEQRGWKTGKIEGKIEASLAIAKNLLDSGISKEIVIQSTGLSLAQIEQL